MSINGISSTGKEYIVDLPREKKIPVGQPDHQNQAGPALSNLSQVTDKSSLSSLAPKLQNILKAIDRPDDNVFQAMSDNVSNLQDAFVDAVYHTLSAADVDLAQKVTLRLDQNDALVVNGDHPEKQAIESTLAGTPELSAAFKEIAAQSELLRDVSNIGKVIGARTGVSSYQNTYNQTQNATYKISMKGDMSHFYFSKG